MLGILYLCLCFTTGYVICMSVFPSISSMTETSYRGIKINVHKLMLLVPAWYLTSTLSMTWLTYILGYLFKNDLRPLLTANAVVLIISILVSVLGIMHIQKKNKLGLKPSVKAAKSRKKAVLNYRSIKEQYLLDIIYIVLAAILVSVLMWRTFYVKNGMLKVGFSVFSDFSPHLLMIRSFSFGNNFPTTYGHYAGEDIRYHFMFQFLAGNLEFLGLRIDYAFNLPSIFSFLSTFSLLYVLAAKITGSKRAAYFAGVFFAFRSSPSLFKYIAGLPFSSIFRMLNDNIEFIGETTNESWGLWNLNVYVNQRHFAFSLSIMLFMLIMFLPLFYRQAERIKNSAGLGGTAGYIKQCFFSKEAWMPAEERFIADEKLVVQVGETKELNQDSKLQGIISAAVLGIILGLSAFFNGAVLICTLMVLFFMAVFSDGRLEYLITAVIAVTASFLQSGFFVDGSVVELKYQFGFISQDKTFFGVLAYVAALTGILFIVLLAAVILLKPAEKYLVLAFSIPFISAFLISFTTDVTVNHKNIMLSIMLLGVFNAWIIDLLLKNKRVLIRILAVITVVMLTATGIYDFTVVLKRNSDNMNLSYNMEDEITIWVKENASSQDIFLTHNYFLNALVLGGGMLYDGWQYYAWSAGYDTEYRDKMVKAMYGARSAEELRALIDENNIRYIVIDYNNRTSTDYILNEELINDVYAMVFTSGTGEHSFDIYDAEILINKYK